MKKYLAVLLGLLVVTAMFSACSRSESYDSYSVIALTCDSNDYEWYHETQRDGVVIVSAGMPECENGKTEYCFLLEAVGEGETKIVFICIDKTSGKAVKTAVYDVSVDSKYSVCAKLAEIKEVSQEAAPEDEINSTPEAENAVEKDLVGKNAALAGRLFFKTEKTGKNEYRIRAYAIKELEDGKCVYVYLTTYIVSQSGVDDTYTEDGVEDITFISK